MNKIRTNISIDPKLKKEAIKVLDMLGIDLSGAISLFLKQVVIHNGLPFDITTDKNNIYSQYKQLKELVGKYIRSK